MTEQEAMKLAGSVEDSIRRASHSWGPDDTDEATTIIYATLSAVISLQDAVRASSPEAAEDHLSALTSQLSREAQMVREYKESRWQDSYTDYRDMHW
jgi:hypothetical protein